MAFKNSVARIILAFLAQITHSRWFIQSFYTGTQAHNFMGCLHDPANAQQTFSKLLANAQQTSSNSRVF